MCGITVGVVKEKNNGGSGGGNSGDRITALGTVTRLLNEFTFSTGFAWTINDVNYANVIPFANEVLPATVDYHRTDIAYLNENNEIIFAVGVEDLNESLAPIVPPNCLLLCTWSIFGNTIADPIIEPVVTGEGEKDFIPIWLTKFTLGNSRIKQVLTTVFINSRLPALSGNTMLSIQRVSGQAQVDVVVGNPDINQTARVISTNAIDNGLELVSYGGLSLWSNNIKRLFIDKITGTATLPTATKAKIEAEATGKAIVTKEFLASAGFKGTNHILLILDGTPTENALKIATVFNALPNDSTFYSIMTLGGRVDSLPDLSLRPYTAIGSLDEKNPLLILSDVVSIGSLYAIKFINCTTINFVSVGLIGFCEFKNVNASSIQSSDAITGCFFEKVKLSLDISATENISNCDFDNVKVQSINSSETMSDCMFSNGKSTGQISALLMTNCKFSNMQIELLNSYTKFTNSEISNCEIEQVNVDGNTENLKMYNSRVNIDFYCNVNMLNSLFKNSLLGQFNVYNEINTSKFFDVEFYGINTLLDVNNLFYNCFNRDGSYTAIPNSIIVNCLDDSFTLINQK